MDGNTSANVTCRVLLCALTALGAANFVLADQDSHLAADEKLLKSVGLEISDSALLDFFRKRTLSDHDLEKLRTLVRQLGDDSFEARENASAALLAAGAAAEPVLRQALQNSDVEVVRRAEECLRQIRRTAIAGIPGAAARLLARRKPEQAAEVLLHYVPFADDDGVAQEVRASLVDVAVRDGKPERAMLAALTDKVPIRRGAAAEALCRAGHSDHEAITKLLKDPEPSVRLQVAIALATAKHKEAVPVLIDLLGQLPPDKQWMAENVLLRLAGDQAPTVLPVHGEAAVDKMHKAWSEWWREHATSVDLAKLTDLHPLGYTLILMLDAGRVLELDARDQVRWQFEGLQFPLDVQLLPNNHVLLAEHHGSVVTERNLSGRVVWRHPIESPLVAQRLPNGNTFIANNDRTVEITRDHQEVSSYTPPNGETIMKAQKLRNGHTALVTSAGGGGGSRFVQIDPAGKEVRNFAVSVRTSGGRIDVLPNGNVLVPENANGRVVEYGFDGNEISQIRVEQPIAAVRLPNGNTLVTSMNQLRAIEFDRRGREIWQYKADTKVTRAFRR